MTRDAIVDGDGHIMEEPNDIWTSERIDVDRWGEWVPHKEVIDEIYEITYVGGRVRGGGRELHDQMAAAVGMTPREFYDLLEGLRRPGGHEPKARLSDMDADGIDAVMLYPSFAMFFGPTDEIPALHDAAFVADCQRVYNDWLADFCAYEPTRLFGAAAAPLQDVAACVRGGGARGAARVASGVRAAVRVRRRASAEPPRLRRLLVDVPTPRRARRVSSGRARGYAGRVPQVRARRGQRERDDHEHGDGRDPWWVRTRTGRRQLRRHDRDGRSCADGRSVRTLSQPEARVPGVERRLDAVVPRAHGRAGEGVPARTPLAVVAPERVLRGSVT